MMLGTLAFLLIGFLKGTLGSSKFEDLEKELLNCFAGTMLKNLTIVQLVSVFKISPLPMTPKKSAKHERA